MQQVSLVNSLPNFSGSKEENFKFFIEQIENLADLEQWDNHRKFVVLKLHCKDQALKFIANDPVASKINNFDQLKQSLDKKFSKTVSFAEKQQNLSSICQKQTQTVKNLAEQIEKAANDYLNIDENADANMLDLAQKLKLNKFLEALRSDIRIEVKKQNPQSFESAIETAVNIENAFKDPEVNVNNTMSFEISTLLDSHVQTNAKIQELSDKIQDLAISKTVNNVTGFSSGQDKEIESEYKDEIVNFCLICGKPHLTIQCWYFPEIRNLMQNSQNLQFSQNRVNKRYRNSENFRGNFSRGNSRGNFRGNSRGNSRGNARGNFRGNSRGNFRGNSSRGRFRDQNSSQE